MSKIVSPYKVIVVVDREFGERLAWLEKGVPIWVVDTAANKLVARRLWNDLPNGEVLKGITTFCASETDSPERVFLGILYMVDLHHGPYSADPPYTVIEGIGTSLTEAIIAELKEYGFDSFEPLANGFRAIRPLPVSAE